MAWVPDVVRVRVPATSANLGRASTRSGSH